MKSEWNDIAKIILKDAQDTWGKQGWRLLSFREKENEVYRKIVSVVLTWHEFADKRIQLSETHAMIRYVLGEFQEKYGPGEA